MNENLVNQVAGQFEIPPIGFILPDGLFVDVEKQGFQTHAEMATCMLREQLQETDHENLIKFIQQGYIRFKRENKYIVVETETYPTSSQIGAIRKAVDLVGEGAVEISMNGRYQGYLDLYRDTLDADMRKLEALLNKVKPPQPKK